MYGNLKPNKTEVCGRDGKDHQSANSPLVIDDSQTTKKLTLDNMK